MSERPKPIILGGPDFEVSQWPPDMSLGTVFSTHLCMTVNRINVICLQTFNYIDRCATLATLYAPGGTSAKIARMRLMLLSTVIRKIIYLGKN